MTNFELAQAMLRLGAVTASALGPAGAAMAFDGQLLSRPSVAEAPLGDALLVTYDGVTAPPPLEAVLSPNGDTTGERQLLAYKVVRPSTMTVSLLGPDGIARYGFSGQVAADIYPYEWNGLRSDSTPDSEGRYRWLVTATDDLGRASSVERRFTLNRTLGFPKAVGGTLTVPRPAARAVASFTLTRASTLTARIETLSGSVLRTLWRQKVEPGEVAVAWDGVTDSGAVAFTGRYVARVIADNELGSVDLTSSFAVRRG
jgi:hypothetical protein